MAVLRHISTLGQSNIWLCKIAHVTCCGSFTQFYSLKTCYSVATVCHQRTSASPKLEPARTPAISAHPPQSAYAPAVHWSPDI